MDWDVDSLITLAALVVLIVGLSAAAVWKIVTRTEDKLREDIKAAVKAAQEENREAHTGIVTRLEGGFKEVNDGFKELNRNFNKLFMEVGEVKGRQKELSNRKGE